MVDGVVTGQQGVQGGGAALGACCWCGAFASAALGLHAVGSSVVQVLVGAAFAVLPGFALGSLLLVGGHAVSVGAARRLRLDQGRWHHQVLCLLLSALGIVLVALLANVGGGLMPHRGG